MALPAKRTEISRENIVPVITQTLNADYYNVITSSCGTCLGYVFQVYL